MSPAGVGRVAPKWFCKNIAQFKQMINCPDPSYEIITHMDTFGFPKNNGPCDTSIFNYPPPGLFSLFMFIHRQGYTAVVNADK